MNRYRAEIEVAATAHHLLPNVVEAVVVQESGRNTHAYRFEPLFWSRYLAKLPQYKDANPHRVSASYGLMQIMYTTAVEVGFKGEPEELFIPTVGLEYGCRKLKQLFDWAKGDLRSTFAAYNGGKADNEPGHTPYLRNGKYAASVLKILSSLP